MLRLLGTVSYIWLVMAVLSVAQEPEPVLDTAGQALQSGVEYYIQPTGILPNALTLVDRNGSCPLYVGEDDLQRPDGLPVIFTPFFDGETVIRENRDFRVAFSAATTCVQTTAWEVAETDPETQRRLIATGDQSRYGGFFRIQENEGTYNLAWCPTDVCPTCRFICGTADLLVVNGKELLALDGPAMAVVFQRA